MVLSDLFDWSGMDPQTRDTLKNLLTTGLAALALGAIAYASCGNGGLARGCSCGSKGDSGEIKYVGDRYAIQDLGGCEVIRFINEDGSFGDVYDIPREAGQREIDASYRRVGEYVRKAPDHAVIIVRDADDRTKCRVVAQPPGAPYRP